MSDRAKHREASFDTLQDENEERLTELRSIVNKMREVSLFKATLMQLGCSLYFR